MNALLDSPCKGTCTTSCGSVCMHHMGSLVDAAETKLYLNGIEHEVLLDEQFLLD